MAKWLRGLKVTRIDLVDRGANPGATVELFKRDDEEQIVDQKELEAKVAQLETANEALTKRAEDAEAQVAALTPKAEPDPIEKADPEVRERIAKAEEEAREARAEIAKMREEGETREYVGKAAALPFMGEAEVFGPVYRKIAKALTADELKEFEQRMASIAAVYKNADILKEAGTDGEGESDPYEKIRKAAVAQFPGKTPEAAVADYLGTPEGAKAHREYVAAQKGQ